MRERKARNTGSPAAAAGPLTVADYAAEGLRLRTEMARAVEAEKWVFLGVGRGAFCMCWQNTWGGAAAEDGDGASSGSGEVGTPGFGCGTMQPLSGSWGTSRVRAAGYVGLRLRWGHGRDGARAGEAEKWVGAGHYCAYVGRTHGEGLRLRTEMARAVEAEK